VTMTMRGADFSFAHIETGTDLIFHAVFIAFVALGALWKNEAYHKALAGLSVFAFALYVATLFTELR